jgi:phenylpropionate dioxygenase-like ring-hydroxylating dioxygenase large terminal subunit
MGQSNAWHQGVQPLNQRMESLVQEVGESLQDGFLPASVYGGQDVFEAEVERVLHQNWVFIGHKSEIPTDGDYCQRYIGTSPFIFTRDENGDVQVLFDGCRHQGAKLCKADQGNTSHFRCPYHGWTYKNSGELAGVPQKDTAFKELDTDEHGLHEAPRVESYKDFVFASLTEDGPDLKEYLGEFSWYLDMQFDLVDGGLEVLGTPHRWRVDADWKLAAENHAGDSYHTQITHRSAIEVGFAVDEISGEPDIGGHRHVTHCDVGSVSLRLVPPEKELFFGYPDEYISEENLTDDQYWIAKMSGVQVGLVFPNFGFLHAAYTDDPDKPLGPLLTVRKLRPVGPGEFEFVSWVLVPSKSSEEYRERAERIAVNTFSPSGNFEQDDISIWSKITDSASSPYARDAGMELNYQMGMPGMSEAAIDEEWPGPGTAWDTNLEEGVKRTFHYNWYKAMSGETPGVEYGTDLK